MVFCIEPPVKRYQYKECAITIRLYPWAGRDSSVMAMRHQNKGNTTRIDVLCIPSHLQGSTRIELPVLVADAPVLSVAPELPEGLLHPTGNKMSPLPPGLALASCCGEASLSNPSSALVYHRDGINAIGSTWRCPMLQPLKCLAGRH